MAALLLGSIAVLSVAGSGLFVDAKLDNQRQSDRRRKVYRLYFPGDLTPEQTAKFLDGISGQMHRKSGLLSMTDATPSLVFEVGCDNESGIQHWLKVPWQYSDRIVPSLMTTVPGIRVTPDDKYTTNQWTRAVEIGVKNSHRPFNIGDAAILSANILTAVSTMNTGESIRVQLVVTPAKPEHKLVYGEAKTKEFRLESLLRGQMLATRAEVDDRNAKLSENNFAAVLRIGASSSTPEGADNLIDRIVGFLKSTNGPANHMAHRWHVRNVQQRMDTGASPDVMRPPMVVTVSELAALLAWRPKDLHVVGMPPIVARPLPASESVPREGGNVGTSTFGDRDRPIAIPYSERTKHVYICGGTGSGKTTFMDNLIGQDMRQGHGTIVIESKLDLFLRALGRVPKEQRDKTIVIDFSDPSWAVGLNLLQQGDHAVAIDELVAIFNQIFKDRESMWLQDLLTHGLHTLAPDKNSTFMDIYRLFRPRKDEEAWAEHLKTTVPDEEIREWWRDFAKDKNHDAKIETLKARLWPILRSNLKNVFGQAQSTFSMADVIKNNMNLFINLAGLPDVSKRLAGTIFINAVWQAVQANPVKNPNFMYIDEFQDFMGIMKDPRDILAKSRSFGLGMVLGNQYLGQLSDDTADAIISNVQSKFIMHSENPRDNHRLAASFGKMVSPEDFSNLGRYEVLARIATPSGTSAPLTMTTLPPTPAVGMGAQVRYASRGNFAKRIDQIQVDMARRRTGYETSKARRTPPKRETPY